MMEEIVLGAGPVTPVAEVTASLAGKVLATVPIAQGQVEETASGDALGRVELTVPGADEWLPSHPRHPLAAFGQLLTVRRGFQLPTGETIGWRTLGVFKIASAELAGGWVEVVGHSLDASMIGDRWTVDTTTSGTFAAQMRAVCSVPVTIVASDLPASARTWEAQSSRREAMFELCDAWGVVPRIVNGRLTIVKPSTSIEPDVVIRGGDGGTLVEVDAEPSVRVPNVVVASSAPTDETEPVHAMAATLHGPRSARGPYGRQVEFFASPLLTTSAQCWKAAETRRLRLQAQAHDVAVRAVTDPSVQLDSVVRVIDEDTDVTIRVTALEHALTAGKEPGTIRGTVLAGAVRGHVWL